jgi:hypothetical protein
MEVTSWVQRNRTYANKILAGTAAEIMAIFKKQGITITIEQNQTGDPCNNYSSDWSETWNQLCDFKKRRLPMVYEASVDHDVTQYYLTEAFLPRNSLAEWPKYLITTDRILGALASPRCTQKGTHNNRVSAPPSAALRFATVLGPGTLSKRLISFAFLLRADARGFWNIRSARTAPCCGQIALRATSLTRTRYARL